MQHNNHWPQVVKIFSGCMACIWSVCVGGDPEVILNWKPVLTVDNLLKFQSSLAKKEAASFKTSPSAPVMIHRQYLHASFCNDEYFCLRFSLMVNNRVGIVFQEKHKVKKDMFVNHLLKHVKTLH